MVSKLPSHPNKQYYIYAKCEVQASAHFFSIFLLGHCSLALSLIEHEYLTVINRI